MKRATGRDASGVSLHDRVGARHFPLGARLPWQAKEEETHPLWGAGGLSHRAQPPEHPAPPHPGAASTGQQQKVTPPAHGKGGTRCPEGVGRVLCFPTALPGPGPLLWGNGGMLPSVPPPKPLL